MSIRPHHYVMSDLHLGHSRILEFGQRPFSSVQEHDEFILDQIWRLQEHDVLWVLGDVAMNKRQLDRLIGVPCTLGLIGGNHDTFTLGTYTRVFTHVKGAGVCQMETGKAILTHIPIHPDEFYRWKWNVHGHLHGRRLADKRYVNVCCEHLGCKPIQLKGLLEGRGVR